MRSHLPVSIEQRDLETKRAMLAAGRDRAGDDVLEVQADRLERTAAELQMVVTRLEQDRQETVEEINAQIKRLENSARLYTLAAAEAPERVLESWPKQSDLIPGRRQFR